LQKPGTAAEGGNEFNPEVVKDVEVGAKYSGRVADIPFRGSIALYKSWVTQIQRIIYAIVPDSGLSSLTINIPEAQIKGVELEAGLRPTQWLDLGFSVAYTDAKFTKNSAIVFGQSVNYGPYPDTPKWAGSVYGEITHSIGSTLGRASLRGDLYFQSSTTFSSLTGTVAPGTNIPSYKTANFRLGLDDMLDGKASLSFNVKNAFKKTYFVGGYPIGPALGINTIVPGAPRTWFVELGFKF
jgi:iron complex outermembrane receptor protein